MTKIAIFCAYTIYILCIYILFVQKSAKLEQNLSKLLADRKLKKLSLIAKKLIFSKKMQKYLVMSKKSSTFAGFFEKKARHYY